LKRLLRDASRNHEAPLDSPDGAAGSTRYVSCLQFVSHDSLLQDRPLNNDLRTGY